MMSDEPERVLLKTPDLAAGWREAFTALFPGVIADGVLDAARLGQLLDLPVRAGADELERFGLAWAGKQDAIRSLLTASCGALHPDIENSVEFDRAENVFIEGDNLEVLKLLQKAYNDRVKLIYIDPPYNTGNDFVYGDDFEDGLRRYLEYTGQLDGEGNRVSAASELGGRRHSRWLSMMYPRLILARNLLTQDGVLLCSINDIELPNLVNLLREVFGEENFLATFIWNNNGNIEQQSRLKVNHEYIVAFARNEGLVARPKEIDPNIDEGSKLFKAEVENTITKNGPANPPSTVTLPRGFPASVDAFEVSPRDDAYPWVLDPIVVRDGALVEPARLRSGWSSRRLLDLFIENRFIPIQDSESKETRFALTPSGAIYGYKKRSEAQGHVLTVLRNMGTTQASSAWLKKEWGVSFDYPKPERLIQHLVATFTQESDVVLDFFAGSGTTAHAVALVNSRDGGRRHSISVNIPEPVRGAPAFEATVADITRRRIQQVTSSVTGNSVSGLRVMKLQRSSFRDAIEEPNGELFEMSDCTLDGEPPTESIAAEVLLKEGVSLDARWERRDAAGASMISADGVTVVVSTDVTDEVVDCALALGSRVVVFLEDGFAGADAVKANAVTNAKNVGITLKTV
jgi:adenine-specific DNA-methyltransferase